MRFWKKIILLALLLVPATLPAQDDIDTKEIVFSHLGDSYGWHILTVGERHITVPLPIIVMGSDRSWHFFSSARLDHSHEWMGFSIASEGDFKGKLVEKKDGLWQRPPLDLSLTKNAFALLINSFVILLIILPLAGWYRKGRMDSPGGLPGIVEIVVEYIRDEVIEPCVGPDYRKFTPFLLTVFFFILMNNLIGLIPFFPGGANVTGNIAVTLILALSTFFVVNIFGTKAYWKEILWPDVPTWLKVPIPIMPLIELVGIFTKPFALMMRLLANMFAGHAVIIALVCVIFITASMGPIGSGLMMAVSVLFSIFMFFLELLVAFLQAYVFTLLSAIFIGLARVKH